MKLLWHVPRLSLGACGLSRRVRRLAAGLLHCGHDVRLLVPRDAADVPSDRLDGVPLLWADVPRAPALHWSLTAHARMRRARRLSRRPVPPCDALLSCQPEFIAAAARRRPDRPTVLVSCCSQLLYRDVHRLRRGRLPPWQRWPLELQRRLLERNERRGYVAARAVAFDSDMTRQIVQRTYRLDPARCHVVHPAVDVTRFRPAAAAERATLRTALGLRPDALVVAWAGRMEDEKNLELLIDAAALARDAVSTLLLIGDGPDRPRLHARAVLHGLAGRVRFTGVRHDVERLLPAADLFVLPSRVESFGLAVVEAMACGLPCVVLGPCGGAVRSGAVESVVHGQTGFVLDSHSPRCLADHLRLLAAQPSLRMRLAHAARARAESCFAAGGDVHKLERILADVCTHNR